ncbi:MAG: peptidylprolyl isomerase [Bacteroidales bacterium]|nr:peptidylprolyl isomerase [Bacteroidales bacterium]
MKRFTTVLFCVLATLSTASARKRGTIVHLQTTEGAISIALCDETPIHRDNFVKLCRSGYYDGILFHRVIKDFMIQGGDPDSRVKFIKNADSIDSLSNIIQRNADSTWISPPHQKPLGDGGPDYTLPAEFNLPWLYHIRGALAAAREGDDVNPEMRSSGSQFYIVYGRSFGENSLGKVRGMLAEKGIDMNYEMWNNYLQYGGAPHLDGTYTVFGHVIDGMKVVKKIQAAATDKNDRPLQDIIILHTLVEEYDEQ